MPQAKESFSRDPANPVAILRENFTGSGEGRNHAKQIAANERRERKN
jgi:hypothetical protein